MPAVPFSLPATPYPLTVDPVRTALVVIDMQRDFLEPGGFGASLGNDVSLLAAAIPPIRRVLAAARAAGLLVVHTREGHRPDLTDAPPHKIASGSPRALIGTPGPMGRILIRGEPGHDLVPELAPLPGEPVIDKPGKGAFHQTDLALILANRRIDTLIVTGVTTEVCVHSTVREACDHGLRTITLADCCASYFPDLHAAALRMIPSQGGVFGWLADSAPVVDALAAA